jgi:ComF family protein
VYPRAALCDECCNLIQPIVSHALPINSKYTINVHGLGPYTDPLRSLILAKHHNNRAVSKQLGALVWQASLIQADSFDYIVPVPLHWMRYARRGYNQAESMAEEIARLSGKPLVHALRRNRITSFQFGLSKEARKENLKHAFELSHMSADLSGKNIVLIDDLMTTGTTLIEAGKALLPFKPMSLQALVISRVI